MPTTCSRCLPLAANSAVTASPTFQPFSVAMDFDTTTPSSPRSATEPAETFRFMTASAVAGSTAEKLDADFSNRASPQPLAETLSTPSTLLTAPTTDGLKPGAWALEVV